MSSSWVGQLDLIFFMYLSFTIMKKLEPFPNLASEISVLLYRYLTVVNEIRLYLVPKSVDCRSYN